MPASARAFLVQDFSEGEISYKVKKDLSLSPGLIFGEIVIIYYLNAICAKL